MSYFTHAINQSPTIYGEAAADMTAPAMKVVAFDNNGKIILPASGKTPIGVVLADAADVKAGGRLNVQVKDICYVLTGASVKRGQNLKAKTDGTVEPASSGDTVIGFALTDAASGKPVEMKIIHLGTASPSSVKLSELTDVDFDPAPTDGQLMKYNGTSQKWEPFTLTLSALTDVDLSTAPTNGQVLKYDSTAQKWKPAADATT
jgi:hypothetical protein